jgi:excisionase family DNA binding protein
MSCAARRAAKSKNKARTYTSVMRIYKNGALRAPISGASIRMQSNERRRLLTVSEVAQELRCSKAHVHHLIAGSVRGVPILPSIQLGRRRLILRATFDAWLRTAEHAAD